jgi:hypothetical protein
MQKENILLNYYYVKDNIELFNGEEYLLLEIKKIEDANLSFSCQNCLIKTKINNFKYIIGKYICEKKPENIIKKLPENMIVCYNKKLIRISSLTR